MGVRSVGGPKASLENDAVGQNGTTWTKTAMDRENWRKLTLNVLYHAMPHKLCRFKVKDAHCWQSFALTHSE